MKTVQRYTSLIIGVTGALGIFGIFAGILLLVNNSFDSALQEFSRIWYWSVLLASGFGLQLGLYAYLRANVHQKIPGTTAKVAASGTLSTGSMIACCAHAVANILPILGVSAAAVFLAAFQVPFILIGVFSNLLGITMMLGILKKHGLVPGHILFNWVHRANMIAIRNGVALVALIVIVAAFTFVAFQSDQFVLGTDEAHAEKNGPDEPEPTEGPEQDSASPESDSSESTGKGDAVTQKESAVTNTAPREESPVFVLSAQRNNQNAVSVNVTPHELRFKEPVEFDLSFNTHSVALNFDVAAIATLTDNHGDAYTPISWEGSKPGGHHRSGTLTFPALPEGATDITLTLRSIANVPERVFPWKLEE